MKNKMQTILVVKNGCQYNINLQQRKYLKHIIKNPLNVAKRAAILLPKFKEFYIFGAKKSNFYFGSNILQLFFGQASLLVYIVIPFILMCVMFVKLIT